MLNEEQPRGLSKFGLRLATMEDDSALRDLIEASVRGLQSEDYTSAQIESALSHVYGVDTQLIVDQSYFVVETEWPDSAAKASLRAIVACGGWSKRKTLYGGDRWTGREDDLLNPAYDAAKIRAFFVHPDWTRRGLGSMILEACESAAQLAGFTRFEMGATLTGVPLYQARGYTVAEKLSVPLPRNETLPIVRMEKILPKSLA